MTLAPFFNFRFFKRLFYQKTFCESQFCFQTGWGPHLGGGGGISYGTIWYHMVPYGFPISIFPPSIFPGKKANTFFSTKSRKNRKCRVSSRRTPMTVKTQYRPFSLDNGHGNPWLTMDIHGWRWIYLGILGILGFLWISGILGILGTLRFLGFLAMVNHGLPWLTMFNYHKTKQCHSSMQNLPFSMIPKPECSEFRRESFPDVRYFKFLDKWWCGVCFLKIIFWWPLKNTFWKKAMFPNRLAPLGGRDLASYGCSTFISQYFSWKQRFPSNIFSTKSYFSNNYLRASPIAAGPHKKVTQQRKITETPENTAAKTAFIQ